MRLKTYNIPNVSNTGRKQKSVWVVCTAEAKENVHVSFLEKILAAVKVELKAQAEFVIFNESEPDSAVVEIINQEIPTKVLFFGVVPKQFGLIIEVEPYQIQTFKNLQILWSENLEALQADKNKKMQLWSALQKLFT